MTEGTVKFFDAGKHFGFINGDDGKSYYFHATQVEGHVTDGDKVSFTPVQGERGPKAEKVAKIVHAKKPAAAQEEEAAEAEEAEETEEAAEEEEAKADEDSEEADEEKAGEDEGSPE